MPADVELTSEQRVVEAAAVCPPHGGVTGWAALHWEHARWFPGTTADGSPLPVWLAVGGEDVRMQPGIAICAERLDPRDLVVVDGVRITVATRSVCFEMRYAADEREAAVVLSMAAYSDLVSIAEVAEYAARHSGWIGIPQCRVGISLAEENCWSPAEVRTVLVWQIDADLPRLLCNQPLFDLSGQHLGTPDFLDVEAGVVGEYDSELHLTTARRTRDLRREERYRGAGLEYFTVLKSDLAVPATLAARMVDVRGRARWEAQSRREWTIEPPPWWVSTNTVALRRALTVEQQHRFLRYRAA